MTEISKEYGAALFMLAVEEDQKENYARALERVKAAFLDAPAYEQLLTSRGIPLEERLGAIDEAFSGQVPENVLSYLKLLCEKGRISCLMESIDEYQALLNASEHIYHAKITSAVMLTEGEKQKLIHKLESTVKGRVCAEYFLDESLLGGMIIEVDGKILDGSLRHRLYEVKEVMTT